MVPNYMQLEILVLADLKDQRVVKSVVGKVLSIVSHVQEEVLTRKMEMSLRDGPVQFVKDLDLSPARAILAADSLQSK
eukprot:gene40176-53092_t